MCTYFRNITHTFNSLAFLFEPGLAGGRPDVPSSLIRPTVLPVSSLMNGSFQHPFLPAGGLFAWFTGGTPAEPQMCNSAERGAVHSHTNTRTDEGLLRVEAMQPHPVLLQWSSNRPDSPFTPSQRLLASSGATWEVMNGFFFFNFVAADQAGVRKQSLEG